MTEYNRGDVILVRFPFTDFSAAKERPAVVISPDRFNRERADIVILAVSSKETKPAHEYRLSDKDKEAAGLHYPSVIRLGNIYTIHQGLVDARIGRLPDKTMRAVIAKFKRLFGM